MATFPVLILLCFAFAAGSNPEKASEALFDITKEVLGLLPPLKNLRLPVERKDSSNATETSSILKRLTDMFSNRGNENRYNILRSDAPNGSSFMERLASTLEPVTNPLKNITTRALQGISKLPLFSGRRETSKTSEN
ncbi:uncharacterized protein [Parasteatoda tepidariorum]|uniref:uncharacterized protein n=1 Tax=Parasteatoda tepidariorum TaxID=114398 RepID=UPI00077FDE10|nr:uncharacterized protein LOC107450726 [Parasteatoda tepidariorum]